MRSRRLPPAPRVERADKAEWLLGEASGELASREFAAVLEAYERLFGDGVGE